MTRHMVQSRTRSLARAQRREPTQAEAILWAALRDRSLDGWKFRRKVPLGIYVADFVCLPARLIVELDGAPHQDAEQVEHDRRRDAWLREQGFQVLRFPNDMVLGGGGDLVLQAVRGALSAGSAPSSALR